MSILHQHLGALRLHWRRHRAFPSMEELAAVLGVKSKGGVHKTLGRLVEEGLLERVGTSDHEPMPVVVG